MNGPVRVLRSTTLSFHTSRRLASSTTGGKPRICLVGAPGSGKGTVSKYICQEFDMHVISTGDILRSHIRNKTSIGQEVQKIMDQGGLVPDDIMMRILEEEVHGDKGWILDGIPRTLSQARSIDSLLESLHLPLQKVYFINVPDEEIISRISGRLVHAASGRTYHLEYNPPKVENTDDETGEPLTQRDDDKPETVKARLEAFREQTVPVLEHFEKQNILDTITASTSDEAFSLIKPSLRELIKEE